MQPVLEPVPSRGPSRPRRRPALVSTQSSRSAARPGSAGADLLRLISDPATPVFLTVHAGGRRRYGYWQPLGGARGGGSCYAALPTDACDALHHAGRIVLGEPVVDAAKTTYRVRAVRTATGPAWAAGPQRRTA